MLIDTTWLIRFVLEVSSVTSVNNSNSSQKRRVFCFVFQSISVTSPLSFLNYMEKKQNYAAYCFYSWKQKWQAIIFMHTTSIYFKTFGVSSTFMSHAGVDFSYCYMKVIKTGLGTYLLLFIYLFILLPLKCLLCILGLCCFVPDPGFQS